MAAEPFAMNRRKFSLGALLALTGACNPGTEIRARAVDGLWTVYRDRFVDPSGRVIDTGNGNISHSEGQSYGMILALHAGDREAFTRIAEWTQATLLRDDMALHSWRYDPRQPNAVSDPNNATDGDIVIAWALALAAQRWQRTDWAERAAAIRAAIRAHCVLDRFGRKLLLPGIEGFAAAGQVVLNPSYFVWPALDHFAKLDGKAVWGPVIADCEALAGLARFGPHRLPTDWIKVTGTSQIAPADDRPPRFGYDAIRVALYGTIGLRSAITAPIAAWWRGRLGAGKAIPAWIDVTTGQEADYAVSEGGAAIVARLLGAPPPPRLSSDYFAASLQMLARL